MDRMYRTLRLAESDEGVLYVMIDAPPMNLIGPELVRELVRLLGELESGQDIRVMVLESADSEYFVPHVDLTTIDRVRIRYADSGSSHKPAVVLPGPWPESVAFAPIWASLAEHARLFAVDLPGFGASERREDLLSPRAIGEFLAQLIAEADLGAPHIVAPDVGTAAADWDGEADG